MAFPLMQLLQGAAEARNAYVGGRRDAQQSAQQQSLQQGLQLLALKRQQQQDQLAAALQAAQRQHLGAQTSALLRPPPPPRDPVADHLANRLTDVANPLPTNTPPEPIVPVVQGGKNIYQPRSKAIGQEAPHTEPQAPMPTIVTGVNPDDNTPGMFGIDRKTLRATPIQGVAPTPKTTKIESAQQELTRARAQSSVSEMNNADSFMQQYENDLRTGKKKIGPVSQYIGTLGNTFMHDDATSTAAQNAALAAINKIDPDFARYIRRSLSFAEGESGISQRPSDFRTRMAAFLSRAASGASPDMLDDVSSRRSVILKTLNRIYPDAAAEGRGQSTTPGGGRGGSGGAPPSYEEWKKKNGIP